MSPKVKFDPNNKDTLVSIERRRTLDPHAVLSQMPITAHQTVADIGCGPGYFTVPLAKYLFDGKVFALDVQREMLKATEDSLAKVNLTNVELKLSKETKLPLESDSVDGALMAFVLQEASQPTRLLKDAVRCLKKSGWLAVLEWHCRETEDGPPLTQRIGEDKMRKTTDRLGLRTTARRSLNGAQYMLLLKK